MIGFTRAARVAGISVATDATTSMHAVSIGASVTNGPIGVDGSSSRAIRRSLTPDAFHLLFNY